MLTSIFKHSPLFVVENLLMGMEERGLSLESFLESVELQFSRVEKWTEKLEAISVPGCELVGQVRTLGLEGTNLMMESLESIYELASENQIEAMGDEIATLEEGHDLVLQSLTVCRKTLEEDANALVDSFGGYMT